MFPRKDATLLLTMVFIVVFISAAPELCSLNAASTVKKKVAVSPKTEAKQEIKTKPAAVKAQKYTFHKVQKGENLYRISLKYKVTMGEIACANNLKNESSIFAGMTLKIPVKEKASNQASAAVKNKPPAKKTNFSWPVKTVISCKEDSIDGVKPIGLIINTPSGSTVHCSAGGVVERVGYMRGYGNFVLVKHFGDYFTIYSYLENVVVKKGQEIGRGGLIGRVDPDKKSLHFQIDHNGKPLNPLNHLPKRG